MTLRKVAALVAALALTVGLFGAGISASFSDSVTADENINVGTFGCILSNDNHTPGAVVATDRQSITYTAPTINSSAPGSAPFYFDVWNNGTIDQVLMVTNTAVGSPFSVINAPFAAMPIAANALAAVHTGVQWGELTNDNLGASGAVTWTVACNEAPAVRHWSAGIAGPVDAVFPSTMAANEAAGWPIVTISDSTITFQSVRQLPAMCMEYRFNDNTPDQKTSTTNYNASVTDGLWPYKCIGSSYASTKTVTIPAGVTTFEVRETFGGETDERFSWTRFNLLP